MSYQNVVVATAARTIFAAAKKILMAKSDIHRTFVNFAAAVIFAMRAQTVLLGLEFP